MIEIRLLGAQSVSDADGNEFLSVSARPKRLALLTYLALSSSRGDGFVSRDRLFALFWPEADAEHARNTLNQYVYRLRGSLGSDVILSRGMNRLGVDPNLVWCDVLAFRAAAEAGRWRDAMDLYAGEFLPGFHVSADVELERWIEGRRLDLERTASDVALARADELAEDGNWTEAIEAYRRTLTITPDAERAQAGLEVAQKKVRAIPQARSTEASEAAPPNRIPRRRPSGIVVVLASVALLVVAASWFARTLTQGRADSAASVADARPSIAVLPFVNMSGDPGQEYFSDGITEELLNTLGRIEQLRVVARTSTFGFKGDDLDVRTVGDSLGVEYVVEGSVRRADDRLRITAQLIETRNGSHLWTEQFDRELQDIFAVQTEIARAIAARLRIPLGLAESSRLVWPTRDVEAYDTYLAGRALLRARGDLSQAVELFERTIARDSSWAPAWAGLAESHALIPYFAASADSTLWADNLEAAERAALRALESDPHNASATLALANVYRDTWNYSDAEIAYARALTLDPETAEAHQEYADFLNSVGRMDEAYAAARRALALDPAPVRFNEAGVYAGANGRHDEALELFARGLELDPPPVLRRRMESNHTWVFRKRGEWREYRQRLLPQISTDERERLLRRSWPEDGSATPEVASLMTEWGSILGGVFWMRLGEHDKALDALDSRYRAWPPYGSSSELFEADFDPLRNHPRFQALLASRGLKDRYPVRLDSVDVRQR